jgi:invasion protein IalB
MRKSNFVSAALAAALLYSPWTKDCPKGKRGGGCVLTSEARRENGDFVASAVVVVRDGGETMLRVGLPLGVVLYKGVGAAVDDGHPASGTYTVCLKSGCLADVEPVPGLLDKLKTARELSLTWTDAEGADASCVVPLDGFVKALEEKPKAGARGG